MRSASCVSGSFSDTQVDDIRNAVLEASRQALTERAVDTIIGPTIGAVLGGGRYDVISIGLILALWRLARAQRLRRHHHDHARPRWHGGIVATRALSFVLYVLAMVTGAISIPLVVAGPTLVDRVLPDRLDFVNSLYWPLVLALCICFLATLYHVSVPVREREVMFDLLGATLSLFCWVGVTPGAGADRDRGRVALDLRVLAAPIAVLLGSTSWRLRLIGAAVNAAFDTVWPQKSTTRARLELVQRLRERISVRDS